MIAPLLRRLFRRTNPYEVKPWTFTEKARIRFIDSTEIVTASRFNDLMNGFASWPDTATAAVRRPLRRGSPPWYFPVRPDRGKAFTVKTVSTVEPNSAATHGSKSLESSTAEAWPPMPTIPMLSAWPSVGGPPAQTPRPNGPSAGGLSRRPMIRCWNCGTDNIDDPNEAPNCWKCLAKFPIKP